MELAQPEANSSSAAMVREEVLNEVTERLVQGLHPEKIILFSSQARGTANEAHRAAELAERVRARVRAALREQGMESI